MASLLETSSNVDNVEESGTNAAALAALAALDLEVSCEVAYFHSV